MIRTQVYLTDRIYRMLTRIAEERHVPMARVVRESLEHGLQQSHVNEASGIEVLKQLSSLKFRNGPTDLSTNLDHYLYGGPKKT